MATENMITFFEAFQRAAKHFYDALNLTDYIEDTESEIFSPEEARKKAFENELQIRILGEEYKAVCKEMRETTEKAKKEELNETLERLYSEIDALQSELLSKAELDEYEKRYIAKKNMFALRDKIFRAVSDGEIVFRLSDGHPLSIENLSDRAHGRFYLIESMGEFLIDKEKHRGRVVVSEKAFSKWLVAQDVEDGKLDTPEKRMIRAKQVYRMRLEDERYKFLPKEDHFCALSAAIPGLLKREFEAIRRSLESEFPFITKPGRPRKSAQKSN